MAEGTYEYACMRAELLGLDKPDEDDFYRPQALSSEAEEPAPLEEAVRDEATKRAHGGFDELNSILASTRGKIGKLKGLYGSLTALVRTRSGRDMSYSSQPQPVAVPQEEPDGSGPSAGEPKPSPLDKLDSLLTKAENAQCSMAHQNKEMKKFLQ